MGFWSTLGKVASIAGPIAAIPFTGGASSSLLGALGLGAKGAAITGGILGAAGKVAQGLGKTAPELAAMAQGRADGRLTDATLQQRQDQLAQSRYTNTLNKANTEMDQAKYALTAPQQRASNSVRGDVLANVQDFSYGAPRMVGNIPVPTSTGGRRPSILSDNTRQLGRLMSSEALASQQAGNPFSALEQVPGLTPLPQPGVTDKILNTAGTIGSLAPMFDDFLKAYKRKPTEYVEPDETAGFG